MIAYFNLLMHVSHEMLLQQCWCYRKEVYTTAQ